MLSDQLKRIQASIDYWKQQAARYPKERSYCEARAEYYQKLYDKLKGAV